MIQFINAVRDIWKKPIIFILFVGQLMISLLFFSVMVEQVIYVAPYRQHTSQISDYNITFFHRNIPTRFRFRDAFTLLTFLAEKDSYSTITTARLPEHPDTQLVIGLGAFADVFGFDVDTRTTVLVGSELTSLEPGDVLSLGPDKGELNISGCLPSGASYVSGGSSNGLDNTILILTDDFERFYDEQYAPELLGNFCLINLNPQDIVEYITAVRETTGLILHPTDLNSYATQRSKTLLRDGLIFTTFFLATLAFVLLGIITSILQLIDSNLREYAIHLLNGAKMHHLYTRTIIYIVLQISFPIFWTAHMLTIVRPISPLPMPVLLLLLAVSAFFIALVPIRKLSKKEFIFYLRSDG